MAAAGRRPGPARDAPASGGRALRRVQAPPRRAPVATRWNNTFSILHTRGGGVVVASEPYYDDPGWADVPDHHLVDVADGVVTVTELEA